MKKQSLLIAVMITLLAANVVRAAAPDSDGQEYIVQPGDWLSKIAGKFYGDILAYPSIVKATNAKAAEDDSFDVIDSPDVIEIDQKLWIPAQAPEPGGVTLMDLKNGVYEGIYAEPVQLDDGKFEGEPFVEGGASRPTVTFVSHAFGDLNGDGSTDAVVALVESSGGSGTFWYLAAMINQDGKPVNAATHFLGDRWQVQSMVITDGEIALDAVTHGPEDPMCCPSVEKMLAYRFQFGWLVQTVSGELTLSDLTNAAYGGIYDELVQLTDGKFEGEPFVEGGASRPTVTFVNHAFGDLNGDGTTDAAVALVENSGGSGVFWYLAAMVNEDGKLINAATQFLGDRWQVQSMSIRAGEIVLSAVTHGPEDPMCCPSVEKSLTFVFQDGQWVETTPATED